MTSKARDPLDLSGISVDRDAEVPIGVQLAWILRARIRDGGLRPGNRLPGLRDLALATGVNINTVKAVYQRLHSEGLIDSQQGSGTFVKSTPRGASDAASIAIGAAQTARECGVDPREVAAALYVTPQPGPDAADQDRSMRQGLRVQIAVLERAFGELDAAHPGLLAPPSEYSSAGPSLLSAAELEAVRSHTLRRLLALQGAIDERAAAEVTARAPAEAASRKRSRKAAVQPKRQVRSSRASRPATAEG
jgi:DNA-binding transcriptional regulator YhcF (GntR family)